MKWFKYYLSRLYISFLCIWLLVFFSTAFSIYSFNRFGKVINSTVGHSIPEMIAAMHLSERSALLTSIAPVLLSSDNAAQLRETSDRMDLLVNDFNMNLQRLDSRSMKKMVATIKESSQEMTQTLSDMKDATLKRIDLNSQTHNKKQGILKLHNDLIDTIAPTVYGGKSLAELFGCRTARKNTNEERHEFNASIDNLMNGTVNDMGYALNIKTEGNLLISLFRAAMGVYQLDQLSNIQNLYLRSKKNFHQAAETFQSSDLAKRNPILAENVSHFETRILAFGEGEASIFKIRQKEIALRTSSNQLIQEYREITNRMTHDIDLLIEKVNNDVARFHTNMRLEQKTGNSVLITVCVISLLLSGLIAYFSVKVFVAHEQDLIKAKESAEVAAQGKSDFLANMIYEIRTSINAIIGTSDLLIATELSDTQYEYQQMINTSAHSLLSMVNDILDFSIIDAGKLNMEKTNFYLNETIEEITDMFREKASEKNLEIVVSIEKDTPNELVGVPSRLRQIIVNLMSNAIKYTEKGEIYLKISILEKTDTHAFLQFSVKDTGIGIPSQISKNLFSAFTLADKSMTRKYGGIDLGLSICKRLVMMMGGDISVDSTPGVGSTFTFTVQFSRHNEIKTKRSFSIPDSIQNEMVMVIDDNENSSNVAKMILASFGFEATLSTSGGDALALLNDPSSKMPEPVLFIIDSFMPGLSGIDTARHIKNIAQFKDTPIILMSAFGHKKETDGHLWINANIEKPLKPSNLFDTIMSVFGNQNETDKQLLQPSSSQKSPPQVNIRPKSADKTQIRILLVEDNLFNQQVVREILESENFYVDIANNGQEAINAVSTDRFDFVLMDIQMPNIDGYEATRRIRKMSHLASLPIIAMTAHVMKGDRDLCLDSGMNDYITKPINRDQLFDMIKKWIQNKAETIQCQMNLNPIDPKEFPEESSKKDIPKNDQEERNEPRMSPTPITTGEVPESQQTNPGTEKTKPLIAFDEGLERLGGNKNVFMQLLQYFCSAYSDFATQIKDRIDTDYEVAIREVHSFKGAAGNLSAHPLKFAALQLETALKEKQSTQIDTLIEDLSSILIKTISFIENLPDYPGTIESDDVSNDQPEKDPKESDENKINVIPEKNDDQNKCLEQIETYIPDLKQLDTLLADADPIGISELAKSLEHVFEICGYKANHGKMMDYIQAFDFYSANETFREMVSELGLDEHLENK
jgi:signal transduction histidine kinase/CheY-like chemotaxis protein/HPt (histidine-containing phosphotransfer) domain-containing protein